MEEYSAFLNLSPSHLKEIRERLDALTQLRDHINSLENLFQKYSDAGLEMCSCMQSLANGFLSYSQVDKEPTITSISNLLLSFGDSMSKYFIEVKEHILLPLHNFSQKNIISAEEYSKTAQENFDNYINLLEKNTINSKKKSGEAPNLLPQIASAYSESIRSDFILSRNLDLIERKRLIELTTTVCFFSFFNLIT